MAVNKNALIRYKTIDQCLQNRYQKWTLEDLIDECSEALYEYEGKDDGVSRRTIQGDIQIMRSDKLGYNAPIIVVDKKYYTYEDPDYSITNIPISDQDLSKLSETVEFLKQFKGFSHFRELDGMVQKLEDHVYSQKANQKSVIDFEKNENLKGIEYLDELYQSIIHQQALKLTYQSFKARQANSFDFHPYLLKEFRNRWFIVGRKDKSSAILNLALDRIIEVEKSKYSYKADLNFDPESYFEDVIGVSVSETLEPQEVILFVTHQHAPYVLTKPFHPSQKLIEKDYYGVTIRLRVQHNFELEKEILGMGDGIRVIQPERLRQSILRRLRGGVDLYRTELNEATLKNRILQLEHKGSAILNHIYTRREINKMSSELTKFMKDQPKKHAVRELLIKVPKLLPLIMNQNLQSILAKIDKKAFLTKAIFFDKVPESNWYVTMHQDIPINVTSKKQVKGYTSWTRKDGVISVCPPEEISKNIFTVRIHIDDTDEQNGCLQVVPGSHTKRHSDKDLKLITANSLPYHCEVQSGGIHLMKPLVLHASSKSKSNKKRRVIHLEFSSAQLDGGLEWKEQLTLS